MNFPTGIIENSRAFLILKNEIDKKNFSHAYMISGADLGEVKAFALTVIRYSMCKELCGCCVNCLKILNGNHTSINLIDKSDRILVDDIKEIISGSHLKPFLEGGNYYIINDAGLMTQQAQNKLLKTLEEAPSGVHFFLCTVSPDSLLNTVKSRVSKIYLVPHTADEAYNTLITDYTDTSAMRTAADYSGGSITKARQIMNDTDMLNAVNYVLTLPEVLKSSKDILAFSERTGAYKNNIPLILDTMEIMFSKMTDNYIYNKEDRYGFSIHALSHITHAVIEAKKKIAANCNYVSVVESLLFTILEVKQKCR